MRKFDFLKQLEIKLFSEIVFEMAKDLKTPENIEEQLNSEITEKELQKINSIAQKENQPLSFSFKQ